MTLIAGGCLCGAVRFEADAPPLSVVWCHCASCRRQTGAPATVYADFRRDVVRFQGAEPTRFRSSPGALRGFCARCGSTLSFEGENLPEMIHIHVGALDNPGDFPPTEEVHTEGRLAWFCRAAEGEQ
ncbi:MAG: GFA family protein [Alphaproteobacteria bacterium]|nr:GFA family protein [Alphaproteobacteria bacterium]